jgi:hypothetical protein
MTLALCAGWPCSHPGETPEAGGEVMPARPGKVLPCRLATRGATFRAAHRPSQTGPTIRASGLATRQSTRRGHLRHPVHAPAATVKTYRRPARNAAGRYVDAVALVSLHLQDPAQAGKTLLDAIAHAGDHAERGGGIFAFASARGVAMLLDDPVLGQLTKTGEFELVVGTDAVTDERALAALQDRMTASHPGLRARVLVHDLPILFHPKLCWFVRGERLTLLVGSGNLTPGGLATNLEAFIVGELDLPEAAEASCRSQTGSNAGTRAFCHRTHPNP